MPAFTPEQHAAAQLLIYRLVAEINEDAYDDDIAGIEWLGEGQPAFINADGVNVRTGDIMYAGLSLILGLFWSLAEDYEHPTELIQQMALNVASMGMAD